MADTSKKSSLKVSMNYTTFNSPKLHSNAHTFGGRPTRKDIERFWLCSVPTFQFLWHKRPTNRFTQYLEFTKKKARVYADKRLTQINASIVFLRPRLEHSYFSVDLRLKYSCGYSWIIEKIICVQQCREVSDILLGVSTCTMLHCDHKAYN